VGRIVLYKPARASMADEMGTSGVVMLYASRSGVYVDSNIGAGTVEFQRDHIMMIQWGLEIGAEPPWAGVACLMAHVSNFVNLCQLRCERYGKGSVG
jgi:hypothetical protein